MSEPIETWTPDPANPLWWDERPVLPRPVLGEWWRHWKLGDLVIAGEVDEILGEVMAYRDGDVGGQVLVVKVRSLVEKL